MTRSKKGSSKKTLQDEAAKKLDTDALAKAKDRVDHMESLEDRLKAAEDKAETNYDQLLRVTAEFENYRKRVEREISEVRKFANESLIKEILPIVDNLERALSMEYKKNDDAFQGIREGVEMTLKGLMDSLEKFGVAPMETLQKTFDPNFHEAVSQQVSEEYPENTVLQELQKGYMLKDRLLRAPMVVVSKRPDSELEEKSKEAGDSSKIRVTVH